VVTSPANKPLFLFWAIAYFVNRFFLPGGLSCEVWQRLHYLDFSAPPSWQLPGRSWARRNLKSLHFNVEYIDMRNRYQCNLATHEGMKTYKRLYALEYRSKQGNDGLARHPSQTDQRLHDKNAQKPTWNNPKDHAKKVQKWSKTSLLGGNPHSNMRFTQRFSWNKPE